MYSVVYQQDQRSHKVTTRDTIVLRFNKFNPGSTDKFEFQVRNLELFGTSLPTSKECVHKNSERYLIQSGRYP